MKTIDIKGKPYITVNERLKYFREHDAYAGWKLTTEIVFFNKGELVLLPSPDKDGNLYRWKPADIMIKASIIDDKDNLIATAHSYEKENSSVVNQTSFVENSETSAWGRVLGNIGIGIDTSVASAEEVINAIKNQK